MDPEQLLEQYAAGIRDFAGVNLSEANLSGVNLSKANLAQANLSVANLSGANLHEANLSRAKFNVARLSGANLSRANLNGANLNVTNLIRANLNGASMYQAALVRAELVLAQLSAADLREANLNEANLKEAKLRQANLRGANLSNANLRSASLVEANLDQVNLQGADLSRADLRGVDLSGSELKQAILVEADLRGADLSGANLRWANLSGANLSGADLSDTKLSGADLSRADLSYTTLLNASLIYTDLNQASLIGADWIGADLTGATLTGAKVHALPRFGVKTEGLTCEWVDLSPEGDRSQIYRLYEDEYKKFFRETQPTMQIVVDLLMNHDAHLALASIYRQISRFDQALRRPPSIEVGRRRTTLTFPVTGDDQLFLTAFIAILPFGDASATQRNITNIIKVIQSKGTQDFSVKELERLQQVDRVVEELTQKLSTHNLALERMAFFQAPTETILVNSSDQMLSVYRNGRFGKHITDRSENSVPDLRGSRTVMPSFSTVVDFVRGFYYLDR